MNHPCLTSRYARLLAIALLTFGSLSTAPAAEEEDTPLGDQMSIINKSFRTIRRDASDPANNAACAELVAKMSAAAQKAMELTPALAADQPDDERAAFIAGYEKEMKVFIGLLTKLEASFKAGDNAKAEEIIGQLRDQQRKSHKSYKKPD